MIFSISLNTPNASLDTTLIQYTVEVAGAHFLFAARFAAREHPNRRKQNRSQGRVGTAIRQLKPFRQKKTRQRRVWCCDASYAQMSSLAVVATFPADAAAAFFGGS